MSKMKYSGIEWIGYIPENWNETRLKDIYSFEKGKNAQLYTQEYIGQHEGQYPVYSGQTENEGVMGKIDSYDYNLKECIFTTTVGAKCMNLKIISGKFSLSQNCLIMKQIKSNINKYIYYSLLPLFEYERSKIPAYMQPSLRIEDLNKYKLYLPSIDEQKLIANFLEEKITNLDNILFDLNKQIEILTSYKKSIIIETVIGGLNKNVKMIESGFNWAKEVPAHWDLTKKIKSLFDFSNGLPITKADLIENGIPVFSYGQIHSKTNKGTFINSLLIRFVDEKYLKQNGSSIVKEVDFIFADTSEDIDGCGNCVYVNTNELLFAGYHSIILRSKYSNHNKYLAYLFLTDNWRSQIRSKVYGVKVFSVTQKILKEAKIILPPENEQKEIADYLDNKCSQIDKIIEEKQKQIEKIEEYKKSIIYEYVTGKKRVEGAEELYG